MDKLPPEMLQHIFNQLPTSDLLNCAMVSKIFLRVAARLMPELGSLKIAFSDCPLRAGVDNMSNDSAWLQVCQCGKHHSDRTLQEFLPCLVQDAKSLELEDDLVKSRVTDEHISMLLVFCKDAPLKRLALSQCDLMNVQPWTLALLARFNQLEKLEMDGCSFSISESMLVRSLSTSFTTLTDIDVRDSKQITDKFSRSISRSCPLLENFRVSGCPLVSTFTVLALIESTFYRVKHSLTVHMDGTPFSADQLDKYMHSPLFASSSEWRLSPAYLQIGFEKPAVLAEHRRQRCVLVYV